MTAQSELIWTLLAAFGPILAAALVFGAFRAWQVFGRKDKRRQHDGKEERDLRPRLL